MLQAAKGLPIVLQMLDRLLLPLCVAGRGDVSRGEKDNGRASTRRGCVLAAEAIRNLAYFQV